MASNNSADSIASALRGDHATSVILEDADVEKISALVGFSERGKQKLARQGLPVHAKDIAAAVAGCQVLLGLSSDSAALELPEKLDLSADILVWRIPLSGTTGGFLTTERTAHIFVCDSPAASPWQNCARQLGSYLRSERRTPSFHFERSRFDNTTEKRASNSFENHFSMELLAPAPAFIGAIRSLREAHSLSIESPIGDIDLLWLSRIFGISFYAAGKRAEQLGLLQKGTSAAITLFLFEKHGGPEARARELGLPPRPDMLFPNAPRSMLLLLAELVVRGEIDAVAASRFIGPLLEPADGVVH